MIDSVLALIHEKQHEIWVNVIDHVSLVASSTTFAVLVGIPLGMVAHLWKRCGSFLLQVTSVLQTIPSLALLGFLIPFTGIGKTPSLIALSLYSLLPIVRNTVVGLRGIPREIVEAGEGLGFNRWQQLRLVQLPLAAPLILAGIRTAAVIGVGVATLAAFVGGGGLGQFINQGLAINSAHLILLGALPAALLAIITNSLFEGIEKLGGGRCVILCILPLVLALPPLLSWGVGATQGRVVSVGTKGFTEQLILGEIIAQTLEAKTDVRVRRRFNLGSVAVCHQALMNGEIDLYPEYTGTALTSILKVSHRVESESVLSRVKEYYKKELHLAWLPPFGFNNTFVLAMRRKEAEREGVARVSDLERVPSYVLGAPSEFFVRPDGYRGLRDSYNISFRATREMDPGLMYKAVAMGEVDVIPAFSTDGRIDALDLTVLEDDRHFFPPYHAAIVAREELLKDQALREALISLSGKIDDATMRKLNYEVDELHRSPASVAKDFLRGLS